MDKIKRFFIKEIYMGGDGDDFREDLLSYLRSIVKTGNYNAMSDHELFLQGGKTAIQEIIDELE